MAATDLCYLGARQALALFKARKLSPVELMEACIARAEAVRKPLNPITETFYDEALEQAAKAEERYAKGQRTRPLEGLPLAVKEEQPIAGLTETNGSLPLKDNIATETHALVQRCFDAGAIMHVRTTTPEFCAAGFTHSRLWGVTRNPWNPELTPGGSSGGTGACLASGVAPLGTGSDIGGSIRIPASACGLVGFKPPYGRNPAGRVFNLDYYAVDGPLARTVADCALLQNVMAGPHPRDIATLRPKLRLPLEPTPARGMKIALSIDLGFFPVDPEVRKNTLAAARKLRDAGCTVEEVELGWTPAVTTAAMSHLGHLFGNMIARVLSGHRHELTDYVVMIADQARRSTGADYLEAQDIAGEMYDTLGPLLHRYDALLCPTTAVPAVKADLDVRRDKVVIEGEEVSPIVGWAMTYPFNVMGHCPVLSVPSGRAKNGVPTGVQIVARPYDDATCFRVGAALEAADPWYTKAARRPKL